MFGMDIGKKRWRGGLFLGLFVVVAWLIGACGPNLPGSITLHKELDSSPVKGLALFQDKWLYVIDDKAKLRVYDVSNPAEPKRSTQVDAFADDSYQMVFERSNQWLIVVGKSGKITIFDLRSADSPTPLWGNGTVLKLKKTGPLMVRSDTPVMYITPGNGTAISRVDLGTLGASDTDQAALDKATTDIPGGGGGGIVMPFTDDKTPLRIYVGNKTTGKIDIWDIEQVEKKTATKPVSSFDTKAKTALKSLHVYQKEAFALQGWILAISDAGDIEYFDLDKRYRKADDPASVGSASVAGIFAISNSQQVMVTDQLDVYDFSAELTKPTQVAKPELAASIIMRSMVIFKEYIFTAEAGGFRVYKYTKAAAK